MLTISGRAVGSRRPLFADFSIPLDPGTGEGGVTLRDLIERVVRAEAAAFRDRQEARRLDRVMTRAQIDEGVRRGRVSPEARQEHARLSRQEVDADDAVATAWQAFEDGLYLVVLDGEEHKDLDREVHMKPDSRVTFVRLVFLAGA